MKTRIFLEGFSSQSCRPETAVVDLSPLRKHFFSLYAAQITREEWGRKWARMEIARAGKNGAKSLQKESLELSATGEG